MTNIVEPFRVPIVGSDHYENALELLATIAIGQPIVLERDPENQYDKNAIKCTYAGVMLGFVPRTMNPRIAAAMDAGFDVQATYAAVPLIGGTTDKPWISDPARIYVWWKERVNAAS